jgi:multiple sugar transport system permease protein
VHHRHFAASEKSMGEDHKTPPQSAPTALEGSATTRHAVVQRLQKDAVAWLCLLPLLILISTILIYPMLSSFRLTFYDWNLGTKLDTMKFVGLQNWLKLLGDERISRSIGITIKYAGASLLLSFIAGFGLALLFWREVRGIRVLRTLVLLPMFVTPVLVGVVWRMIYDPVFGHANYFLGLIDIAPQRWLSDPNLALLAAVITDLWKRAPYVFLLILSGLQALPEDIYEMADVDGASAWAKFWHLTLPLLSPVIAITLVFSFVGAIQTFDTLATLTHGGPGDLTKVYNLRINELVFQQGYVTYGAAGSYLLFFVTFGCSWYLIKTLFKPTEM